MAARAPTRAVIPAAGRGTRLRPATLAVPKELVSVDGVPMVQRAVAEAAAAGLRDVAIVVARGKEAIRRHFETDPGPGRATAGLRALRRRCRLTWIVQDPVAGLGDALWRARGFCGGEPFVVLMPDNVFDARRSPVSQLLQGFRERGGDWLGAIRLDAAAAAGFSGSGRIRHSPLDRRSVRIERLLAKRAGAFRVRPAEAVLRAVGRGLFGERFFRHAADCRRGLAPGEALDDVPILQRMVREGGVYGRILEGIAFDAGNLEGLRRANAHFASRA